jgi:hypothetical protein
MQQSELNKARKLNYLGVLISDFVAEDDLADLMPKLAQLGHKTKPFQAYEKVDFGYALQELKLPIKRGKRVFFGDAIGSKGRTFLICDGNSHNGKEARFPGCRHYFRARAGVDVSATYRFTEISRWRNIQEMIDRFLDCSTKNNQ